MGFPGGSDGKESACKAGDLGSIPGLERSPGEGIGYPLQYFCASLVAQMVKESTCSAGDLGSIPGFGRSCLFYLLHWQVGSSPLAPPQKYYVCTY